WFAGAFGASRTGCPDRAHDRRLSGVGARGSPEEAGQEEDCEEGGQEGQEVREEEEDGEEGREEGRQEVREESEESEEGQKGQEGQEVGPEVEVPQALTKRRGRKAWGRAGAPVFMEAMKNARQPVHRTEAPTEGVFHRSRTARKFRSPFFRS